MARKVLKAAKCSQMSNPRDGTGNGGDRCTEACAAIIADTYQLKIPGLAANHTTEAVMYYFTQMLNKGRNVSALENAAWIGKWMSEHGGPKIGNKHLPGFADIVACIDRGHIAIGGFNAYENLRLSTGQNPYKWTDHGLVGHVLIIVGYDTTNKTVIVHDPLRANPSGQPADYTFTSFQKAGFADLSEVNGDGLNQSQSLLDIGANVSTSLAPDESVVNFLVFLDQEEKVVNPFENVQAQTDNLGPVSFTDPVSWAGSVMNNFWGDIVGISFRLLIVGIGVLLLVRVIKSWLPEKIALGPGPETANTMAMFT